MTSKRTNERKGHEEEDLNRDPISGAKGAHPVGSGVGAVGGGVAGAAIGAAGGPVGVVAGAIVGGLVGGLAGKGVAEYIDPTVEHEHWRGEFENRDDRASDRTYDDYGPAYQYGWESSAREVGKNKKSARRFDEVEADLGRDWESHRGENDLAWDEAKPATRDAYERTHNHLYKKV